MTAIELDNVHTENDQSLNLGWYADMPEGTLAAYDELLDTTLRVVDRMSDLATGPGKRDEP